MLYKVSQCMFRTSPQKTSTILTTKTKTLNGRQKYKLVFKRNKIMNITLILVAVDVSLCPTFELTLLIELRVHFCVGWGLILE